jgi:hypothetical protein
MTVLVIIGIILFLAIIIWAKQSKLNSYPVPTKEIRKNITTERIKFNPKLAEMIAKCVTETTVTDQELEGANKILGDVLLDFFLQFKGVAADTILNYIKGHPEDCEPGAENISKEEIERRIEYTINQLKQER